MAGNEMFGQVNGQEIEILDGPFWMDIRPTGQIINIADVKILAPIRPSKIIMVGLNYRLHVQHSHSATKVTDYPLIFLKPPTTIIGPEENIVYPDGVDRVDYEAELGVVMGQQGYKIPQEKALEYVFGYTCVNDVTARNLQKQDGQWTRAKGFDTFCPVGPRVVRGIDVSDVAVEAYLNGKQKQHGRTADFIFQIPFLVEFISSVMTLLPGDLISTGTPQGIDPMNRGDRIEVRVENVGSLINKVI
jgi:2-keto-4-pentenoate hydratase/2-oxohepta-3-ene-1,7-dioic acid hydratase in catechol pathway